jgi:murein DD-endopeptidase MepM/ murein hydrolase activator NlpD
MGAKLDLVRSLDFMDKLRKVFPYLVAVLGVLAAAWATSLNARALQPTLPEAMSTPSQALEPYNPADIHLPAYAPAADTALARQAELKTNIQSRQRIDILMYTVQAGDSVFGIAEQYSLNPETILFGNFDVLEDDPHTLRPGQELVILPVDGTYYQWESNDTIEGVASDFGVDPEAIIDWPGNRLDPFDPTVEEGQYIVVPGGTREFRRWVVPVIPAGSAGVGSALGPGGCSGSYSGAVGTGSFVWPSPMHYVSGNDYWSGHLAIDIAAGVGTGISASDSGVVVFSGWSTVGYGIMIMIDHGNGYQTLYAHLSQTNVGCGQSVSQGQIIGLGGSTGNSTGPHLHFEVRFGGGYINPWQVLQ